MKPDHANQWKDALLDEILEAISSSSFLAETLIFKGARILARHLPDVARRSLDIDANCTQAFVENYPDRAEQAHRLESEFQNSIRRKFESEEPVKKSLEFVRVRPKPPQDHPRGWNAFEVSIRVIDSSLSSPRGVPTLRLDIAAPETLTTHSTQEIEIGGRRLRVYTLERIAGEKLRAFLSSTPAHQAKTQRTGGALRVKDLHDLACILRNTRIADNAFWDKVAVEFRTACAGRFVDCDGWPTFAAVTEIARGNYEKDPTLPRSFPFDSAWAAVHDIIRHIERTGTTPFAFALPAVPGTGVAEGTP
jgi:hypothetical protein